MAWTFCLKSVFLISILSFFFYTLLFLEKLQLSLAQRSFFFQRNKVLPRNPLFSNFIKSLFKKSQIHYGPERNLSIVLSLIALLFAIYPFFFIPFFSNKGLANIFLMPEFFKAPLPLFTLLISSLLGLFPLLIETWLCGDSPSYLSVVRQLLSRLTSFIVLFFLVLSSMFLYKTADFHTLVLAQQNQLFLFIPSWGLFTQPLGAIIFSILISLFFSGIGHYGLSSTKENDLLLGRYRHNDALSYYIFKLADHFFYMGLLFLFVFLFLGGYASLVTFSDSLTSSNWFLLIQIFSLFIKVALTHYVHIWISFAIPTLKWNLSVKIPLTVLFPLSLCNLIGTLLWFYTYKDVSL